MSAIIGRKSFSACSAPDHGLSRELSSEGLLVSYACSLTLAPHMKSLPTPTSLAAIPSLELPAAIANEGASEKVSSVSSLKFLSIDVISHLSCSLSMYRFARCYGIGKKTRRLTFTLMRGDVLLSSPKSHFSDMCDKYSRSTQNTEETSSVYSRTALSLLSCEDNYKSRANSIDMDPNFAFPMDCRDFTEENDVLFSMDDAHFPDEFVL